MKHETSVIIIVT